MRLQLSGRDQRHLRDAVFEFEVRATAGAAMVLEQKLNGVLAGTNDASKGNDVRFEQAGTTVAKQFGGLGLGLAISRAILDLHGGAIGATSGGKGQGACFTIQLKTIHTEEKLIGRIAKGPPPQATQPTAKLRLLVVEDNDDTRRVLCRLLTSEGYEVAQATTVAAAPMRLRTRSTCW